MPNTYYWVKGEITTSPNHEKLADFIADFRYREPEDRYGRYVKKHAWEHVPLEQFPKKFQMFLLVMGDK